MKALDFERVVSERCDLIKKVLTSKGVEYASDVDRLHNFKKAAEFLRVTPAQACLAFMTKHLISVADIVEQAAKGTTIAGAIRDEKIGDAINYLILLEALFQDPS